MVTKSAAWSGKSIFISQGDAARLGEDLLYRLFLATEEIDELGEDLSALPLAQLRIDRQPLTPAMPRRRVLPPRRHLRNK